MAKLTTAESIDNLAKAIYDLKKVCIKSIKRDVDKIRHAFNNIKRGFYK